jgi:hypothetical protein
MESLPGAADVGERLQQTALRDFGSLPEDFESAGKTYKQTLGPSDAPVPSLLRYALTLTGLQAHGPDEKVAWWIGFAYRGERCLLAHQKFGLRLYLTTERSEEEAAATQGQIVKQLRSAVRSVERLILDAAPQLLGSGHATVINQHTSLRRAYDYFRERAVNPAMVEDEVRTIEAQPPFLLAGTSFKSGKAQMALNAFHDMVAAITAYLSLLEHDLVLALPFCGFDPAVDDLTGLIGARWGEKFDRVLGKDDEAARYRRRLFEVVERWRNPYSHGGFEKGHGATIYLHTPGVGAAVPVGLTRVRESPMFSFLSAGETDIAEVFALFDEIDAWLEARLPEATLWTRSALDARFDEDSRRLVALAREEDDFAGLVEYCEYQRDMIANMDY